MKTQVVVVVFAVIGVLAVVFAGYRVVAGLAAAEVVVSCDSHSVESYCVYHRATPRFLSTNYDLVIGTASDRGLLYEIPYPAGDVTADWDLVTDLLTITMPGTTLTITKDEYRER
ncbi:hypothetical protein [Nocardia sp. NPDC023988]|uniref:hypothetical protein n=1 Tax=unclassified Nocardia TaxID=2637762 RepID=UPI0033C3EFDC